MRKCGTKCTACPYIRKYKQIKINGKEWKINGDLHCKTFNVVYAIVCRKDNCRETKRFLKFRLDDHREYIVNKHQAKATGEHFNLPGHRLANVSVTALEKVKVNNLLYREERERNTLSDFSTLITMA